VTLDADIVVYNARIATMDVKTPGASALAIRGPRIVALGTDADILGRAPASARRIDAKNRRVVPGIIDSHLHVIRGGLSYNMELRWDGVPTLEEAMRRLRAQVIRTPPPQWVRVVGGRSELQFRERRMPTLDEINRVAPDTPVFILHLYSHALLNGAALRAVGYTKDTPDPPGGTIERDRHGNPSGLLVAKPNAAILYATLARGPLLPREDQENSTRQFLRDLNRLGVTAIGDAGGGYQRYPDDYAVVSALAKRDELSVRIAYSLFTQRPGSELEDFQSWTQSVDLKGGTPSYRCNGAGEMLVYAAADFEDFLEPRPDLPPPMEEGLGRVVEHLVHSRWPFRLHATYDESIGRMLDVFEGVDRRVPFDGLRWFIDHAETITPRNIDRIARLGGGIAIQHRMAYQGEYFAARYGEEAARHAPPIKRMLAAGVRVGAGTDATRVASYNPWVGLWWLVTGKTVGGMTLNRPEERLSRDQALRLYTCTNDWFLGAPGELGTIGEGKLADLIVLSEDYFEVPEDRIRHIESQLTIVGGRVVHASGEFGGLAPPPLPFSPGWGPPASFGGYDAGVLTTNAPRPPVGGCACAVF
jgi:predicted amidohydrolase YtcJ